MTNYLKIYAVGFLAVWMTLYGLMLCLGAEWMTGAFMLLLAMIGFIEVRENLKHIEA